MREHRSIARQLYKVMIKKPRKSRFYSLFLYFDFIRIYFDSAISKTSRCRMKKEVLIYFELANFHLSALQFSPYWEKKLYLLWRDERNFPLKFELFSQIDTYMNKVYNLPWERDYIAIRFKTTSLPVQKQSNFPTKTSLEQL